MQLKFFAALALVSAVLAQQGAQGGEAGADLLQGLDKTLEVPEGSLKNQTLSEPPAWATSKTETASETQKGARPVETGVPDAAKSKLSKLSKRKLLRMTRRLRALTHLPHLLQLSLLRLPRLHSQPLPQLDLPTTSSSAMAACLSVKTKISKRMSWKPVIPQLMQPRRLKTF